MAEDIAAMRPHHLAPGIITGVAGVSRTTTHLDLTAATAATMAVVTAEGMPEAEMPAGPMAAAHRAGETAAVEAGMGEAGGDQAVEHSALQGWLDQGGVTLKVVIYRVPSIDTRWLLEVIDHEGRSTC